MPITSAHATKPFRFGLQVPNAPTGQAWRDLARKAEDLGFSTLFMPDHFGDAWSPTVPLTVAAEATSTLRVGALVYDNDYRHPLVLARDMAALDLITEGRVEFGLGAGWMTSDYEQSGIVQDPAGVRIDRMEEALEVFRQLWTLDNATFDGTHYQLREAKCRPVPFTPGGPPVLIGGGGKRVLGVAARHASIIGVNPELYDGVGGVVAASTAVADRYHERIGWIRDAAGARFDDIELQILCQYEQVTSDRDALYAGMAPMFGLTAEQAAQVPVVLAGTVEQIIEQLQERRAEFGFSYVVVHDLDAFAPVVAALAGK
jgi:probable F420-dependent oxidoreductase